MGKAARRGQLRVGSGAIFRLEISQFSRWRLPLAACAQLSVLDRISERAGQRRGT